MVSIIFIMIPVLNRGTTTTTTTSYIIEIKMHRLASKWFFPGCMFRPDPDLDMTENSVEVIRNARPQNCPLLTGVRGGQGDVPTCRFAGSSWEVESHPHQIRLCQGHLPQVLGHF